MDKKRRKAIREMSGRVDWAARVAEEMAKDLKPLIAAEEKALEGYQNSRYPNGEKMEEAEFASTNLSGARKALRQAQKLLADAHAKMEEAARQGE
ncbi:hypothetical protein LMG3458_02464 [Achromobacter deleyi]|uniref:Uncharacterized protein n=2 Tax=Achromobacter deleyi TaxID=1353891 RepID=A0A6S6ZUA2_9BURK|nr:hypothetical protein LMG3458_02464 [Achromobacter deleyi]